MGGTRIKIHPHRLHVHGAVGQSLGAVDDHAGIYGVRPFGQLRNGVYGSERIRYVVECQQLRLGVNQALGLVKIQASVGQNRNVAQRRPRVLGQHLPRNQVAVVLQLAHHDLVARAKQAAEPVRHQIDRTRRARRINDFVLKLGVHQPLQLAARRLKGICRTLAQRMHPAVHVAVDLPVVVHDRIDHRLRLLCRRRIIQIHQRLAVHLLVEDGKFLAERSKINHGTKVGNKCGTLGLTAGRAVGSGWPVASY